MTAFRLRKLLQAERGAFAIIFAILLPVLLAVVGLGVDVSLWYMNKRQLQAATDAAAVAAVLEKAKGSDAATIEASANVEASRNGWKAANGSFALHNPPLAPSAFTADATAVQVVLSQNSPMFFARIFMEGENISLNAKSTARLKSAQDGGTGCILALHTTQSKALEFAGNVNLSMPNCAIASNSNASGSISLTGSASVTVYSAQAVGVISDAHSLLTADHGKTNNASAITDPYASLAVPSIGSTCDQTNFKVKPSDSESINASGDTPYVFCNGLDVQGTLTLGPGTYVINKGSLNLNSGASLTAHNATFIVTSTTGSDYAKFDMNGNASVNLSAPSSGTYKGVLLYADRNGPYQDHKINGTSSAIYNGALYLPSAHADFNGNSGTGSTACTQLIAKTIKLTGNAGVTATGCTALGAKPLPLSMTVIMVE
jgi:Flp pilus assembly protein TadG